MRILITEDHETVRKAIHKILIHDFRTEHIKEAEDGDEAVQIAQEFQPDIILMDLRLPKLSGIEAAQQILIQNPNMRIIVLSMHLESNLIVEAFQAGCKGFVSKTMMLEDLVTAIREVSQGNKYLSSDISNVVSDEVLENGTTV